MIYCYLNAAVKLVGAEKFGITIKIDHNLDKKVAVTSFPKKLAIAKENLRKLKRK